MTRPARPRTVTVTRSPTSAPPRAPLAERDPRARLEGRLGGRAAARRAPARRTSDRPRAPPRLTQPPAAARARPRCSASSRAVCGVVDHPHVGRQAALGEVVAVGGEVAGDRQLEGAAVAQRLGGLHEGLAEGALADQLAPGRRRAARRRRSRWRSRCRGRPARPAAGRRAAGSPSVRNAVRGECRPSVTTTVESSGRKTPGDAHRLGRPGRPGRRAGRAPAPSAPFSRSASTASRSASAEPAREPRQAQVAHPLAGRPSSMRESTAGRRMRSRSSSSWRTGPPSAPDAQASPSCPRRRGCARPRCPVPARDRAARHRDDQRSPARMPGLRRRAALGDAR